jgi:hypothetical protein
MIRMMMTNETLTDMMVYPYDLSWYFSLTKKTIKLPPSMAPISAEPKLKTMDNRNE